MRWLVLGYGNPLRGDDRVGHAIAEACTGDDVQAMAVPLLTPELASDLAEADGVVFVDARHGPDAGRVRSEVVVAQPAAASLSHALTPAALLYLTGILYGKWPKARLVTVETSGFRVGAAMSAAATRGSADAIAAVRDVLEEWRRAPALD